MDLIRILLSEKAATGCNSLLIRSCARGYRKSYCAIRKRGRVSCKAHWLMSHPRLRRLWNANDASCFWWFNRSL